MEGDPRLSSSPGANPAQGERRDNTPNLREQRLLPSRYHEQWTADMAAECAEQNERLEREEDEARRLALQFEAEDFAEEGDILPKKKVPGTVIIGPEYTGLRYICPCEKETKPRALYIKRIRRPLPRADWAQRYPWLADWFQALATTCPDLGGHEEVFRAAVVIQMASAVMRCEVDGHRPHDPRDPELLRRLGNTIQYTDVPFPSPWLTDMYVPCSEFSDAQDLLRRHIVACTGSADPIPSEDMPEHLLVASLRPPTPLPLPEESPPAVVPDIPPVKAVTTETPAIDEQQPKWGGEEVPWEEEDQHSQTKPQSPSKGVQTDRKRTKKWVREWAHSMQIKKAIKTLVPRSRSQDPPRAFGDHLREPDPPSPEKELFDDTFFDDEPTDNELFKTMAWAGTAESFRDVPCTHHLIDIAVANKKIESPHLYCAHVRRALACHIIRHPDYWGVSRKDREMLAILASLGYIKKEVLTTACLTHPGMAFEDDTPIYDLKTLYNVEVSNRFEILADEPDMLDAHQDDIADAVCEPAQAAQRANKRKPPPAKKDAPERERRRKEREGYTARAQERPRPVLSPEERRRNAKAAMRRILAKITDIRVSHEQVAMTVLRRDRAPQVDMLLQEWHSWLRYPTLALQKGLLCWLAACRFNQVDNATAVAMVYKKMYPLSVLCTTTGSSEWIRDLTTEGIEPNPGPGITAPTEPPASDEPELFETWCSKRDELSNSLLTTSKQYVEKELSFPSGVLMDVNYAVIVEAFWMPAQSRDAVESRVPVWTTTLYPTTVAVNARKRTVLGLARDEVPSKAIPSVPLPTSDSLARAYVLGSPRPEVAQKKDRVEKATDESTPWRGRLRSAARQRDAATSGSSTPTQDERPAPAPAEPEGPPEEQYPSHPRVVLAGMNDFDSIIRSARSMGSGVAFAVTGQRFQPAMRAPGIRVMVVGRVNDEGHGVGELNYADRRPIVGIQRENEEDFRVVVGDVDADRETAAALRAIKSDNTPSIRGVGGARHFLLGEWYGSQGNGVPVRMGWRTWGPLHYVYNARTGYNEGTELIPTPQALAMTQEAKDTITITPRFDITARGLDTTTDQAIALSKPPGASSCEANAFKMGLLAQWARYGMPNASRHVILTGQLQVHEPNRRIKLDTPVVRLCNNTGRPNEDCGGLITPAFPFMEGYKRGRIRFYSSAQCVPTGRRYLILPPVFENVSDFSEAAVFILSFLPWPFANLSLALETTELGQSDVCKQIFSWFGTTTVVPGELELDIVLHMSNVGRVASRGRDDEPVLTARPSTGGTGVEYWPPRTPIPVNYTGNTDYYIPAATFAVSWALTITPETVNTVIKKIAACGVFDKVERWVTEAQLMSMTHAGIMATDKATLQSRPPTGSETPRIHITAAEDDDPVPLLYRCWWANGSRTQHIPAKTIWCNVRLPPADSIIVPDVFVISQIVSGYYNWATAFGELTISIDSRLLAPAQFVASEKFFVAWHVFHYQVGIPVRGLAFGSECRDVGKSESLYYTELFNSVWDPSNNGTQLGCVAVIERVMGGLFLADTSGNPVLHRVLRPLKGRWQPQIWDLQDVNPMDLTCATPMPDVFMFKYSDSLPHHLMPFMISRGLLGNKDYKKEKAVGGPPIGFYGPYKFKCDDLYYRLEPRAMPYVVEREVWENRLMHAMPEYVLRQYQDGAIVEGSPQPGDAPISFPRGGDDWAGEPPNYNRPGPVYPFFSTMWAGWADPDTHNVLMLMCVGDPSKWYALLEQGIGGMADGLIFDMRNQPLLFRTPAGGKHIGPDRLAAWSGNGYQGASSKGIGSASGSDKKLPKRSGDPKTDPDPTESLPHDQE